MNEIKTTTKKNKLFVLQTLFRYRKNDNTNEDELLFK